VKDTILIVDTNYLLSKEKIKTSEEVRKELECEYGTKVILIGSTLADINRNRGISTSY